MLLCENLEYGGDQILLSLTLQWEISHELHYRWLKKKNNDQNIKMNLIWTPEFSLTANLKSMVQCFF